MEYPFSACLLASLSLLRYSYSMAELKKKTIKASLSDVYLVLRSSSMALWISLMAFSCSPICESMAHMLECVVATWWRVSVSRVMWMSGKIFYSITLACWRLNSPALYFPFLNRFKSTYYMRKLNCLKQWLTGWKSNHWVQDYLFWVSWAHAALPESAKSQCLGGCGEWRRVIPLSSCTDQQAASLILLYCSLKLYHPYLAITINHYTSMMAWISLFRLSTSSFSSKKSFSDNTLIRSSEDYSEKTVYSSWDIRNKRSLSERTFLAFGRSEQRILTILFDICPFVWGLFKLSRDTRRPVDALTFRILLVLETSRSMAAKISKSYSLMPSHSMTSFLSRT